MKSLAQSLLLLLGFLASSNTAVLAAASLAECLSRAKVPFSLPTSSTFFKLAQPYNLRLQYVPSAIVLPTTVQHVSRAVVCAAESKVKVQAKSGGHSYASFSSGGQNGSMVVSLEAFQIITVDSEGVAQVGGGVRLGNLATGIYNLSKRALPHGVCPGVGIGGHATHGGYWYSSRGWGLTLDTIVGLEVVLANGSFVHATSSSYTDIFWALRGAADSIGIITKLYLQTQPAPTSIVNWVYNLPISSPTVAAAAFTHIQNFALNASIIDEKIGFGISPSTSSFRVSGSYRGDEAFFKTKIAPELLRTLPTPSSSSVKTLDWLASLVDLWGGPLAQPLSGYNAHDNFYAKSILVPEASPLTPSSLLTYFTYISTRSPNYPSLWFSELNLLGGPHSLINSPSPLTSNSAYSPGRGALWVIQHYSTIPSPANGGVGRAIEFVKGLNDALGKGFGAYMNYVDPELSKEEAWEVYYGKGKVSGNGVYERLVRIKGAVDPQGVFWNPLAVGA